jgi:hypothetical protein
MSGPIVRKYGFPNHDKIFGKRDVPHGTEEPKAGEKPPADAPPGPEPSRPDTSRVERPSR